MAVVVAPAVSVIAVIAVITVIPLIPVIAFLRAGRRVAVGRGLVPAAVSERDDRRVCPDGQPDRQIPARK